MHASDRLTESAVCLAAPEGGSGAPDRTICSLLQVVSTWLRSRPLKSTHATNTALPSLSYDGRRIVAIPIAERLAPVHIVTLRLRRQTMRPAVRLFADFLQQSFQPGGLFHRDGTQVAISHPETIRSGHQQTLG